MTAWLRRCIVCIIWITSCLFQLCQANCEEGNCFRLHPGWESWYVWMGVAFTLICCCGTIASWCRHIKSKQRSASDPRVAGIAAVHVTATSGSLLEVHNICNVPIDTTKPSTQPEQEDAARASDTTAHAAAAAKQYRVGETTDNSLPPAYSEVYPSPPLYCEVPPLPTYEEARNTSSPTMSRL